MAPDLKTNTVRRKKWPVITHTYSATGWFPPGNQRPAGCHGAPQLDEIGHRRERCPNLAVWKHEKRELRAILTAWFCDDHLPDDERGLWGG